MTISAVPTPIAPGPPSAGPPAPEGPGSRLGRYRLAEKLGEGGTATVWLAVDETCGVRFAVKVLHPRFRGDALAAMASRFRREARLARSLRHPNVVAVVADGLTEDQRPFLVLELLRGETLRQRLDRIPPWSSWEFLTAMLDLLDGLEAVHQQDFLHRDLKPDNIFLVREDDGPPVLKLLDLGMCRAELHCLRTTRVTNQGALIGTPAYMPPEQVLNPAAMDRRSDLYAVGAILYEAFAGRLPFDGANAVEVLRAAVRTNPPLLSEIRPEIAGPVSNVIDRAMAKDPTRRFPSASAMREALEIALAELPDVPIGRAVHVSDGQVTSSGLRPVSQSDTKPYVRAEPAFADPALANTLLAEVPPEVWDDTTNVAFRRDEGGQARPLPRATRRRRSLLRRRSGRSVLAVALAAAVAIGTGVSTMLGSEASEEQASRAPLVAQLPPELEPSPAPAADPLPDTVQVQLVGILWRTRVAVDGEVVEPDAQGRIELPRDGQVHVIEVVRRGYRGIRLEHQADGDGRFLLDWRRRGS